MASSMLAVALATALGVASAEKPGKLGCTALAVDGDATVSGSAFAGMNADCSDCDARLAFIAPAVFPEGARREVYVNMGSAPRWVGHGRGAFYEPTAGQTPTASLGSIPQVRSTFGYWEAVLPLMNDQGLAFGESSCAAMLVNEAKGIETEGHVGALLDLTTLMQVALERCATARCAIELMGQLSEDYGFFPMTGEWEGGVGGYGDAGEALTVADATGESWVFHVVGGVPGRKAKSVWAAQRLPRGHVTFIPNNFILREVPEHPTDDHLFSYDLRGTAEAAGLWKPSDGPLHFTRVFAPDTVTFVTYSGVAPIPLYASLRLWRLFDLSAPSLNLSLQVDPLDLPFSVLAEKKLSHRDAQNYLRDLYNNTEFDVTKGVLAGPFGSPFLSMIEGGRLGHMGQRPRGISIQRTVYGVVGEPGHGGATPLFWYAADAPATSVFVPYYPASGDVQDAQFATGTNKAFSRESAWWAFDFVNNWMQLCYRNMSEGHVYPLIADLQDDIDRQRGELEAGHPSNAERGAWQKKVQGHVVRRWWELADFLIMSFNDNFFNTQEAAGRTIGYSPEFMEMIGVDQDVHPIYVQAASPPTPFQFQLPHTWDWASLSWVSSTDALAAMGPASEGSAFVAALVAAVVGSAIAGVVFGRRWERSSQAVACDAYLSM